MSDPVEIKNRIAGVFLPVTTPFDAVTGEIAPVAFRENLRRWVREPINGIVLFGSTGEGALLEEEEKVRLTAFAREVVPPEVVLVAGANTESTRGTIREAKRLAAEGAELVLVHTPVYFAPALSHATVLEFFRAVAGESPVPVLIYHMPKFTHVTIEAGLMAELVRLPNVVGFKDSSGDVQRFADYTRLCREDARMLVGSGALFYTALELGAVGGILAIGDLHAARCADVYRAFRDGDTRRAGELQSGLTTLHKDIVAPFGARGIKTALDAMGWAGGPPRPPLVPLTDKEEKQVLRTLAETGLAAVA